MFSIPSLGMALASACEWVIWLTHSITEIYTLWRMLLARLSDMYLTDVFCCSSIQLDIHADACQHTFATIDCELHQV